MYPAHSVCRRARHTECAGYAAQRPRAGIARGFDVDLAVANHHGLFGSCTGFFHQRTQADGIGFLQGEAVAAVDMKKVVCQAEPLADASRRAHRLVGEHRHGSRCASRGVVHSFSAFKASSTPS